MFVNILTSIIIDKNVAPNIICSCPRRTLVKSNSLTLADQLGVPIYEYVKEIDDEILTSNFNVTYHHSKEKHTSIKNKLLIFDIILKVKHQYSQ